MTYPEALAITLVVEVPGVAALFPRQRLKMALAAALATTATHLIMHFALPRLTASYDQNLLFGETLAVVAEAAVYTLVSRPRDLPRALVASGLANILSYLAGLLLLREIL
jgi:hypothetical protein